MDMAGDVREACRLCLCRDGNISVLDNTSAAITHENIYQCVSVKITKDDDLPKGVCETCLVSVANWCSFKTVCDQTQEKLHKWLVSINLESNTQKDDDCSLTPFEEVKSNLFNEDHINSPLDTTSLPLESERDLELSSENDDSCGKENNERLPHIPSVLPCNEYQPNEEHSSEISSNLCLEVQQQIPEINNECPIAAEGMEVSENEGEAKDSMYIVSSDVNSKQSEAQNSSISSNYKYVNVTSDNSPVENSKFKEGESVINSSHSSDINSESLKPDINTETSDQSIDNSNKNIVSTSGNDKTDESSVSNNKGNIEPENDGVGTTDKQNLQSVVSSRNETSLDSDKENARPNSPGSGEIDNTKEIVDVDANENSSDADGQATFSDIKIEFTSTCESDVYFSSFPESSNQNSDASDSNVPNKDDEDAVIILEDTPEKNNPELSEQMEIQDVASETANEAGVTSSTCPPEDNNLDRPPVSQSPTESEKNAEFASSIVQIKQEPDDGTPDEPNIQPVSYLRVKTEFSSIDYEEELNAYPDGRGQMPFSSGGALSPIDPTQTECFICNRKYSTASNYRQHLQTKVHLFNAAQFSGNSIEDIMTEESPVDSPLLRSRLSSESLNSSGNQLAMQYVPPGTVSPRKKPEWCKICNVSFIYTSELRRHLQSKKHLSNERLFRDGELPPPSPDQAGSDNSSANDSRSIFICPIEKCHFSCVTGGNLLAHMKIHGIEQPENKGIEQSNNLLKPKFSLRQHDIRQHDMRQHDMRQHDMIKKESDRRIMTVEELQQDFADQGEFECEGCSKLFLRESGLRKHTYYCAALRSEKFKDDIEPDEDMEEPVEVSSNEGDNTKPQAMHHCPLCDLSFTARNVFINHVQIYHKGSNLENGLLKLKKPVSKPVTKAPYLQVSNKMRVTNKTHGFMCDICGKKFNLLSSLNYHIKTHTVGVKHICRICKEPFNARKSFMEHCRRHFLKPGSKETLCHKCFKVFKTRSELYYHRKNDLCSIKLKIFSCNLCQHSFKDAGALEEHKIRFHSESIDMAEDEMHSSPIGELYDDNYIPLNPLNPLDVFSTHDNSLPGTSSKANPNYNKNTNPYNKNTQNFNNRILGGINTGPNMMSSKPRSPFHCDICGTDYASMQSLKKHIKKFHILNKPFTGRKYSTMKKANILQANYLKQWKCRHCNQGFSSRKILVFHLKRCQYNALALEKGRCLQCGNWCESGKTRICRYCLPDMTKFSRPKPNTVTGPDLINYHPSKLMKQEFIGHPMPNSSSQDSQGYQMQYSDMSLFQQQQIGHSNEILKQFNANNTPKSSSSRSNQNLSMSDIRLMKCPLGNKYFRNEVIMVKHYSQCDGSCENRCSHCRKMFNSPKEYKLHLINARCFGPKKIPTKYSYSSKKKVNSEDRGINKSEFDIKRKLFTLTGSVDGPSEKIPDDSADGNIDSSCLSEDINYGQDMSSTIVATVAEEKSMKIGRVCTICNKVISMQRAIYRHVYNCFKVAMLSQDSISCQKCLKTFSKQLSMKENTTAIKRHVLSCHFIPYFVGEGLAEDGSRLNVPPPLLCYVCSFGFSTDASLQRHIKDHRTRKDDVNNIVLQLEDELLSDERLADEKNMHSLYVESEITNQTYSVKMGRVLSLQDTPPPLAMKPTKKFFQCDRCLRRFTNKNKFIRHKKVHGIVTQSVLNEVSDNLMDLMTTNTSPDN